MGTFQAFHDCLTQPFPEGKDALAHKVEDSIRKFEIHLIKS